MSRAKVVPTEEPAAPAPPAGRHSRGKRAKRPVNPFNARLAALRPKAVEYAPSTTPSIEGAYAELEDILNGICR